MKIDFDTTVQNTDPRTNLIQEFSVLRLKKQVSKSSYKQSKSKRESQTDYQ